MKMKHINAETFKESEIEIEDFHYSLADGIRNSLHTKYYPTICDVSEILTSDDNKLILGLFKNRKVGEPSHKYKITIEKLPDEKD